MLLAVIPAQGQTLSGKELVSTLRMGGYVIVMRHASSPRTPPDPGQANADNIQHERQLDETGRSTALALGQAMRQLHIPIGQVLSSPTYRALETIRLAKLGQPMTFPELGDSGQSMQADTTGTRAAWIIATAATPPAAGTNTLMVTHFPNIMEAFPQYSAALTDGEALIFHPDGHGEAIMVARVKIDEWPHMAAAP
jgi:phosphohistidine phosphatase SixA